MYNSQRELFLFLKCVFEVKNRINKYYKYNLKDEDIWNYLSKIWREKVNLGLCDVVNDIITFDVNLLRKKMVFYE